MALAPGHTLLHYRLIEKIGEGGMGLVWKALDTNLDREVALKVLPSRVTNDPAALARFRREAKVVAALSHPHILAVHDLGSDAEITFVVMELLEGENLRERITAGPMPLRKTVEFAGQIARGLAAAHDKGIVHRDLKPENVFVTREGRIKILDFGLAKLVPTRSGAPTDPEAATMTRQTDPGAVIGTVGYMSPEQVRGEDADARSDIFSLGVILYEMATGKRAFSGDSAVEIMNAILKEEPADLQDVSREVSPALERIIRHCLEKRPEERFQSARDVAFDLEAHTDPSSSAIDAVETSEPTTRIGRPVWFAITALVAVIALAVGLLLGRRDRSPEPPRAERITYRQGTVWAARFAGDETVVFSASWDGEPMRLFVKRADDPMPTPLDLGRAHLLSVSASGELAILKDPVAVQAGNYMFKGTLARAEPNSSAARELIEDVYQAEWAPDGEQLAIVREADGVRRLEFPPGTTLYETRGHIRYPRFSPSGNRIAFLDHATFTDDRGSVAVVDLQGNHETVSEVWPSLQRLAWSPSGDEVWFAPLGTQFVAVTLEGRSRVIARPEIGGIDLHDVSPAGKVLLARVDHRNVVLGLGPGEVRERNLSWLDFSVPRDITADGTRLLFMEQSDLLGTDYAVALRGMEESDPVRLGRGEAFDLSPDENWVLASLPDAGNSVVLLPTGAGQPRTIPLGKIRLVRLPFPRFFPDGDRLLVSGAEEDEAQRSYVVNLDGSGVRPITPEEHLGVVVSPDGRWVAAHCPGGPELHAVDDGESRSIGGIEPGDEIVQWRADGRSLFVIQRAELPARVSLVDIENGDRTLWKEIAPADRAGVAGTINTIVVNPDGSAYAYRYVRILSELYLADGLR